MFTRGEDIVKKGVEKDLKTKEGKSCDAWLLLSGEEYKIERPEVNKRAKERIL